MNIDIEKETLLNEYYRRVIYTDKYQQVVLMSIAVGEDIPLEIHEKVSQFFRIEKGNGEIILNNEVIKIKDGSAVVIPPNTYHHVINTGTEPLKLYTIYSPPEHLPDRIDIVKPLVKLNFTGNKDTDILIMLQLNDIDLNTFCKTNKYIKSICDDDMFWKKKVIKNGAKIDKNDDMTWKEYYFYKIAVLKLNQYVNTVVDIKPKLVQFFNKNFTEDQLEYIKEYLDMKKLNLNMITNYIIIYLLDHNMIFYDNGNYYFRPDNVLRNVFNIIEFDEEFDILFTDLYEYNDTIGLLKDKLIKDTQILSDDLRKNYTFLR